MYFSCTAGAILALYAPYSPLAFFSILFLVFLFLVSLSLVSLSLVSLSPVPCFLFPFPPPPSPPLYIVACGCYVRCGFRSSTFDYKSNPAFDLRLSTFD